jgi:hypothetical protein
MARPVARRPVAALFQDGQAALEEFASAMYRRLALEPIALPRDRVDDVDFDERHGGEVFDRPGRAMSAKTKCSSSKTVVVPFGDRFGLPSRVTVATNPRRCSRTTCFMSSVNPIH